MPEERTLHRAKDSPLSGREYQSLAHFLLECECPHCQGSQWHPPGAAECIYCGRPMNLNHLKIVRFPAIAVSGETPGPDVA